MKTPFHLILFFLLSFLSPQSEAHLHLRRPRFLGKFSRPPLSKTNDLRKYPYEVRFFEQPLDHFGFDDLPTFPQRYLINFDHWVVGPDRLGPIFFYCGNEGDIEWFAANTGFVWELAPQFGALVVFPEHRYYGESMPYGGRDEAYKNASTLAHLTAEQALADFSVLLTDLKRNLSAEGSPVISFGGSYGGMLAAWMRLKYPHIATGALASSAPILQFEDIVPPETFYNIVSNDFKRESTSCFNTIKESWDIITSEGQIDDGLLQMGKTFHLCRRLQRSEDLADWLDSAYSYLAMVDYPYPSNFLMPLPANPIQEVCRKIDTSPDGSGVLERIFEGACTEMVMPMSSNKDSSMFPEWKYNYSSYEEQCWEEFHVKPRPTWISTEFGGHDFKDALKTFGSNIIFSNGRLDPWSGGGVLENVSETIVALITEKGAHHIDLRTATADDPDWLLDLRATGIKLIEGWLVDYYRGEKAVFDL